MSRGTSILALLILSALLIASCSHTEDPDEDQAVAPPLAEDFFPAMAVGDSVAWDFTYFHSSAGVIRTYCEGIVTWHCGARSTAQGITTTTVRQVFRGFKATVVNPPLLMDTVYHPPEETVFTIVENKEHQVTLKNGVRGSLDFPYGGPDITFPRVPGGSLDTLKFSAGVTFNTVTIRLKRSVGLLQYTYGSGAGMGSYNVDFKRRQL